MSPGAQVKVALLESYLQRVQHLHSLVENFAVAKTKQQLDQYQASIKRSADQLKLALSGAGLDTLSQLCGAMVLASARQGAQGMKTRILRENMASLRFQLDHAIRTTQVEDAEFMRKLGVEKEARKEAGREAAREEARVAAADADAQKAAGETT